MAVLPDSDRKEIFANWMREISSRREAANIMKADLRAAFNAIDDWVDNNTSSFNTAIPLPARTSLTAKQKAELLMFVIKKRWEVT